MPYAEYNKADTDTVWHRAGARDANGKAGHAEYQTRNYFCGHLRRNDPASRRIIQYAAMSSWDMYIVVRDMKTGQILVKPPMEMLWLVRQRAGVGRGTKGKWVVTKSVGPEFFEEMDVKRKWHLGFTDVYDVTVWDAEAGGDFAQLFNDFQKVCWSSFHPAVSLGDDLKLQHCHSHHSAMFSRKPLRCVHG